MSRTGLQSLGTISLLFSTMRAHLTKKEFKFVAISVMVLEVASFLVFVFGTLGAILGTYSGISTTDFILLGFGGIFIALILMALAELLQLIMKIEYNTRKENTLLSEELQVEKAEVTATRHLANVIDQHGLRAHGKLKKPHVKKLKPKRR